MKVTRLSSEGQWYERSFKKWGFDIRDMQRDIRLRGGQQTINQLLTLEESFSTIVYKKSFKNLFYIAICGYINIKECLLLHFFKKGGFFSYQQQELTLMQAPMTAAK